MADENANASNQVINTTQPQLLRGLIIRGQKYPKTIRTVLKGGGPEGEDRYMTVNEEDYDKSIHGSKVDKLPTKKKSKKKTTKAEK